jgi:hypothetical protein
MNKRYIFKKKQTYKKKKKTEAEEAGQKWGRGSSDLGLFQKPRKTRNQEAIS